MALSDAFQPKMLHPYALARVLHKTLFRYSSERSDLLMNTRLLTLKLWIPKTNDRKQINDTLSLSYCFMLQGALWSLWPQCTSRFMSTHILSEIVAVTFHKLTSLCTLQVQNQRKHSFPPTHTHKYMHTRTQRHTHQHTHGSSASVTYNYRLMSHQNTTSWGPLSSQEVRGDCSTMMSETIAQAAALKR